MSVSVPKAMNHSMRGLMKCSQCGAMLPPGTAVCPRDGARGVAENPFGEEATVRRESMAPRANAKAAAPRPQLTPAPVEEMESVDEGSWEATVSRDVLVGKTLGDFVVKRRIGAGGMGIVYEGEHPIIGRKVAIKILRPEFSEGGGARDLIAEARAASAIRHRGIIDVFGFGTIPHVGQYLVMEYLEGSPLDEIIAQRAPMLELEVIALMDELLGALAAAHATGVIHRDLKPGNIFVVRDSSGAECVKVLDFGLAKRSEVPHGTTPQTRASMIVGTPEYMAPEQATGQAVGPHTDLYAVGVIAFEMLTRRLPFEGPSGMAIAIQHVQSRPPAPSTYVDLHPALDKLVLRLLAKTPSERPASADAVRRELKAISKQLAEGATRLEPAPKGEKPTDEMPSLSTSERLALSQGAPAPRSSRASPETLTAPAAPPRSDTVLSLEADEELSVRPTRQSPASTERVPTIRANRLPRLAVGAVVLLALAGLGLWSMGREETPVPVPVTELTPDPSRPEPIKPPPAAEEVKPPPSLAVVPPTSEPPAQPPEDAGTLRIAQPTEPVVEPPQKKTPDRLGMSQTGRNSNSRPTSGKATESGKPGILHINIRGWAMIYVDGKERGRVPPTNDLELPPGRHTLLLVSNPSLQPYQATIDIKSGATLEHNVKFQPVTGP
ncbi:serine/threonine-protein kinase [Hyalangium gracile]|uniref:serine/threonine-protein kinase n=1 Tax=Hyalangium gracile TaxID=394092 RepID=UPI001CC97AE7|nr:serine/threonine-protein kinase [Hyalangium gracile]